MSMVEIEEKKLEAIAKLIDHTALGSDVDEEKVEQLCQEARRFGFKTVFVQPCRAKQVVELLKGSGIGAGTVAGFPFGANHTEAKAAEAAMAAADGVTDVDMVINVGWIKDGRWEKVEADIAAVVKACRDGGPPAISVKVIIETCLLTDEEKKRATLTVVEAGADYVKTSTGYMGPGANAADVALLRAVVGPDFGVKASGGIRTKAQLEEVKAAGANRIGTSAGVAIMDEYL